MMTNQANGNAGKCLLAVFAHPDDESFGCGGTLARYAAEGYQVHLVTATRGEAGEIAEGVQATKASLAEVRERELECACAALGIEKPHLLGYIDGQLTIVHQGQAVAKLVRLIRDLRPQVILTFGPDGIYGHYDHIAVHRWVTIAVRLAADAACFPDNNGCEPHQVSKLYYTVLPEEFLANLAPAGETPAVMMDGVPFPFTTWKREAITTWIDISPYVKKKMASIRCHATQVGGGNLDASEEELLGLSREPFVLAQSTVGWTNAVEDDLFTGIT
ncbi:MAG: PIG-L deacetylase family protein [Anaerolineae bacterium]